MEVGNGPLEGYFDLPTENLHFHVSESELSSLINKDVGIDMLGPGHQSQYCQLAQATEYTTIAPKCSIQAIFHPKDMKMMNTLDEALNGCPHILLDYSKRSTHLKSYTNHYRSVQYLAVGSQFLRMCPKIRVAQKYIKDVT